MTISNGIDTELLNTLIAVGVGAVLGALLSYVVGVRQALKLDRMRRQQNEISAALIVASELSRIITWHEQLIAYKDQDRPFEVWGMFIPINSLGQHRSMMKILLTEDEFKDLEDAYIGFSTLDREMQGVVQAWSSSGHKTPSEPAVRWSGVFWNSIRDDRNNELVDRLRLLIKKLDNIAASK